MGGRLTVVEHTVVSRNAVLRMVRGGGNKRLRETPTVSVSAAAMRGLPTPVSSSPISGSRPDPTRRIRIVVGVTPTLKFFV